MGRPPCCDKVGIKKGPWTPEEDIILVSYIQEHGPGNWSSVPTNTGLMRCSKSCRLRWTNYLRPGIKRGNFTPHEEGIIIHLQALMGNKWAAIATYLPQRTDNDIKNYWNTHLKKKLKKFQPQNVSAETSSSLMEIWMRSSSSSQPAPYSDLDFSFEEFSDYRPLVTDRENGMKSTGDLEKLMSCESSGVADQENVEFVHDDQMMFFEKWLLDENGDMEIPQMY